MMGRCRRRDPCLLALLFLCACADREDDLGGAEAVLSEDGFLTITADDYRVLIHPDRRSVVLEVPQLEFEAYLLGRFTSVAPPVATRLYRHFRDTFDFLLIVNNRAEKPVPSPVAGESSVITNDVGGLGLASDLDLAELRGLPPVDELEFVLYLPNYLALTNGPSLHELMHRWGNYIVDVAEAPGHWGFSNVGGQLGGFTDGTLEDLGDGTFSAANATGGRFWPNSNGGNVIPYAPLELYLMGLLPPEAVPPLSFAMNPSWLDDAHGVFRTDGFVTLTASELAATWGPRVPDSGFSQKRFRTLIVLVTSPDEAVDYAEWSARVADFVAERESDYWDPFSSGRLHNFWSATGGLASLDAEGVDRELR
jgi:hypothetical protein